MDLRCIIVDDDKISLLHLQRLIEQEPYLSLSGAFTGAEEASAYLVENVVDLIFLDIEMPGINGFQLLDTLSYMPHVILTTSKTEYAFTAFQYNVTDYLKKPLTKPRFKEALEKVKPSLPKHKSATVSDLFIKTDGRLIRLHDNEILFVEALGDYVKFVTENNKYHLSLTTLKSIEEKLNGDIFLKVHRSYIINTKKINDIEDNSIVIGKHVIPISKSHRKRVMDKLNIV
ncbi:LytTR family DNA-binding domain-containing protein [Danxiaibacter flavus]|uniref:LytTR family DNA-binding domain-containing protein n=1 Tax=Danxiaibacter flavus TaxID=3049108 RepID=A0ABV3ZIK8_9BACT|nr:LytTR family DNA-binding domain-containing protein [Chitinophagaceae bacterium DXS]